MCIFDWLPLAALMALVCVSLLALVVRWRVQEIAAFWHFRRAQAVTGVGCDFLVTLCDAWASCELLLEMR